MKKLTALIVLILVSFSCSNENQEIKVDGTNVSSRILAPNGVDPIVGAKVTLTNQEGIVAETESGVDGRFTLTDIQPDVYELEISKGLFSVQRTVDTNETITICHYPPGNTDNPQTITISANAWSAHEAHGDTLGPCDDDGDDDDDDIELLDFILDNLPNIAVVTGHYDNIESVLYDIGLVNPTTGEPLFDIIDGTSFTSKVEPLGHGHSHLNKSNSNLPPNVDFTFEDLISDVNMLSQYDIIFFNCGLTTSFINHNDNLDAYVQNGGILYATDWAYEYLYSITNDGADYIDFVQPFKSGTSTTTMATVGNPILLTWLDTNFGITIDDTIEIDEFLSSWQVVDTYDAATTLSWFNGEVTYGTDSGSVTENKDLMFTFAHGNGYVLYSSFHTENHTEGFSNVDRIMEYQIFEITDQ